MGAEREKLSLDELKHVVAGEEFDGHAWVPLPLTSCACRHIKKEERSEVFRQVFSRAQEGSDALQLNGDEAIRLFGGPPKSSLRRWRRLAKQGTPFLVNQRFMYALVNFALIWVTAVRQFGAQERASAWMRSIGVIQGKAGRTPLSILQEGGPDNYRAVRTALRALRDQAMS